MHYATDILTFQEEAALLRALPSLPFKEFEFHGFLGKRRVVSFGWHYDFNGAGLRQAGELPGFLLPVRELAARFAGIAPAALEHVLLLAPRVPQLAGTRTVPHSAMSSVFRCSPPALSAFAERMVRDGSAVRSSPSRVLPICCEAPPATNGSTASHRSTRGAFPSHFERCGPLLDSGTRDHGFGQ